ECFADAHTGSQHKPSQVGKVLRNGLGVLLKLSEPLLSLRRSQGPCLALSAAFDPADAVHRIGGNRAVACRILQDAADDGPGCASVGSTALGLHRREELIETRHSDLV